MNNDNSSKKEDNKELDNSELTPNECDLYDLFINEYNDLFENILNLKGKNIYAIMKRNVYLLIGKEQFNHYSKSSQRKVYNRIKEEYFEPDNIVIKNLEDNLETIEMDLPTLNIDSIFAHCKKCYECTHICGEPLYNYIYYDLIICLKCKMIYKKNMIRLFCTSCKEEYYSYIVNELNYKRNFFPATWEKYHCFSFNHEQMRCPECISPLYYSEVKDLLKCFKCNWSSCPANVKWICEVCGKKFNSKVKEFIKFETKPEINCIKYALINRIHARPYKCKCCGINPMNLIFFHIECGGEYFLSYLQNKIRVVCSKCRIIQNPDDIKWECTKCNSYFFCNKIVASDNENTGQKNIIKTRSNFFLNQNNKNIKNILKIEKRVTSNDRYLTSKLTKRFKANEGLKMLKTKRINNYKSNNRYVKTINTSRINNNSNILKNKNSYKIKKKVSNSSINFYIMEKNFSTGKLNNTKVNIKKEEKIKIEEETKDDKIKKIEEIKAKNKLIEKIYQEKDKLIDEINKQEINKIIEENETESEKTNEKYGNNFIKNIVYNSREKIKNKDKLKKIIKIDKIKTKKLIKKKKILKEIEIYNIDNNKQREEWLKTDINISKEKYKVKEIENNIPTQYIKKTKRNINSQNKCKHKNSNNNTIGKICTKGQSQKRSKNNRHNLNLYIQINNTLDNRHKNNSIHIIKETKSPKNNQVDLEPNENFNPDEFKIVEKIGSGSFGKIYKVIWIKNNKDYAMKIINLKYRENIEDTKKKLKIVDDFLKETNCKGVIRIYGSLYEKKEIEEYKYYILMELARTDWEDEIKYRSKHNLYYTEDEIFNIISQLVQCFALLQKHNVSHRDVKPQNILILNDLYKVCDFGEARIISGKNGYIHQLIRGSELYMSPILFDALNNHEHNVLHNSYKSDVFSLGMCIFLAMTLSFESVYEIREEKNMENIRKALEKYLIPHYSNFLVDILYNMLQVDEDMRPNFIELENLVLYS